MDQSQLYFQFYKILNVKKVKVDLALKIKEKKLKEKAKNLNELVSGVEKKKKK